MDYNKDVQIRRVTINKKQNSELNNYLGKWICELCLLADANNIERNKYLQLFETKLYTLLETCDFTNLRAEQGLVKFSDL